jgi:hypothetical protein
VDAAEERRPRVIDDPAEERIAGLQHPGAGHFPDEPLLVAEEVPERDPLAPRDVRHLPHRHQGGSLRVEPGPLLRRQPPPLLTEEQLPR